MRWPKYWSFSFSIIPSKEHPGLISFRMDWLDFLAVQGTLKSLLQQQIDGGKWKQWQILFSQAPKSLWTVTAAMKLKDACFLVGAGAGVSYDKPRQWIKKQRHHFAKKGLYSQSYGFSSSHVQMWELDHKEGWAPRIDVFELWCWRKHLRVPWTARRANQSTLKELNPEYSLEGQMLKLKH